MIPEWDLDETFSSASGTVRWKTIGPVGAEAVVLVHGTPFSSFIWREVASALAADHRVYVWDMPGYGASEKRAGQDLSLARLGAIFHDLLGHWGLDRPHVLAHDTGGAVALGAHLLHGPHYAKLALVDAVALPPWGSAFSQLAGAHPGVFDQLPSRMHEALLHEYIASASGRGLGDEVLDRLAAPWTGHDGQAAFYRQLAARRTDGRYISELRPRYASLDVSDVILCWGEDDTWVPVQRGRELSALLAGARLTTFPRAGHLVHEDAPADLTALLAGFLETKAGQGSSA